MSKNTEPIFTKSPVIGQAAISAANPNTDGTGTIVEVVDGQTDGIRIDQIEVKAEGVTTLGMVRLFLSFDSGVTWELWREVGVAPVCPSLTRFMMYIPNVLFSEKLRYHIWIGFFKEDIRLSVVSM